MDDPSPNPIQVQDEILQVMFWMQGEGLGRDIPVGELARFLSFSIDEILQAVGGLVSKGQIHEVRRQPELVVALSAAGRSEGMRRFRDEFQSYLGHTDHLVCDDPDCDCHTDAEHGRCSHLSGSAPRT